MCLSGEREMHEAQASGHRDGSGVLQVVKRLEQSARKTKALGRKLDRMPEDLSSVES